MNKILVLSLIGLGLGFAAPAFAKDQSHPTGDYASSRHDDGARNEVRGSGQSEPTYMAIQTRSWVNSD